MKTPTFRPSRGFSLPELMVAVAIGLVLTLTISTIVARQESIRRGATSGNDLTSNTAYASLLLDQELRSAGAGFSQSTASNYSCRLNVSKNGSQLLPASTAFPVPFASVPRNPVLAPLMVYAGLGTGGSDIISVATGNAGLSEAALQVVQGSAAAGRVKLTNTLGMRGGDLVLVSQPQATPPVNCMLEQVSTGFSGGTAEVLTFGGTYAADVINGVALADFAIGNPVVSVLGNVSDNVSGTRPRMTLIGIDANNVLKAYDLLQLATGTQDLVEGVVDLRVRYGVTAVPIAPNPANRNVSNWVLPTAAGYTATELSAGTPLAQDTLRSIVAVRVGLVLRSDLVEKTDVTKPNLTLFADLPAGMQYTYTVPTGSTTQRYRTVEFTVPLRNTRFSN